MKEIRNFISFALLSFLVACHSSLHKSEIIKRVYPANELLVFASEHDYSGDSINNDFNFLSSRLICMTCSYNPSLLDELRIVDVKNDTIYTLSKAEYDQKLFYISDKRTTKSKSVFIGDTITGFDVTEKNIIRFHTNINDTIVTRISLVSYHTNRTIGIGIDKGDFVEFGFYYVENSARLFRKIYSEVSSYY